MALDEHSIAFLAAARRSGVSFSRCATMGRQAVVVSRRALIAAYSAAGVARAEGGLPRVTRGWVDPLLRDFGAVDLVSIDASDYEGASHIFDMNGDLPDDLIDRFSVVVDVGTLEHMFDFPTAARNYMSMIEEGGHLLLVTPTNNEAGHGFYQFSPELLFRVFAPAYGFVVEEMLLLEIGARRPRWYAVKDPAIVGSRAEFRSRAATYLFLRARRTGHVGPFYPPPQQSDYVARWEGDIPAASWRRRVAARMPMAKRLYVGLFSRRRSLFVRRPYRRISSHFRRVPKPGTERRHG